MCKPPEIDRKLGRMMLETLGLTWRSAAIIVAHPDDEVIWCGGLLVQNPQWDWTIMSLCRGKDNDRRRKFDRVCDLLQAQGVISDLDDSNRLKLIDPVIEVGRRIRQYLCDIDFGICITHGENGEYGHERHRQVHAEVLRLVCNGVLRCHEMWTFAYACDAKTGACKARHDADIRIELTAEELAEKKRILRDEYGYAEDSFEVKACVSPEGFHRHSITDQGKHR
ncbi:MAG: PIG-L family deacetylase [Phycisphaerae bacterium]|nr:PIG-L family deacetylase [Phycisphaerae bacterium]